LQLIIFVTKLLGNRSRWRKNSVLSSSQDEKLPRNRPHRPYSSHPSQTVSPPDADTRTPHRTELSRRHSLRVSCRAQPHHRATELTKATCTAEHTLLFQRVPTNDRGWVEFNNGANFKKKNVVFHLKT
jgi:hypothetical protein